MNKIILTLPKLASRAMATAALTAAYEFQDRCPHGCAGKITIDGCRTPFEVFVNDDRVLVRPATEKP